MTNDPRHRMVALLPRMRAYALSLTQRQSEADDLVQSACERALGALESFERGTNLDAWIMRILRNLWIDRFRRARAHPTTGLDEAADAATGEDGRIVVEGRSELGAVARIVADLPEQQRSVLVLVCVDGLSYREAAEVLEVPVGTVMSRLARARRSVAAGLERPRQAGREARG